MESTTEGKEATRMTKHWMVEGTQTAPPEKVGSPIRTVCESHELETAEQALWFGAGQLRGMGFVVEDVRVERAAEGN